MAQPNQFQIQLEHGMGYNGLTKNSLILHPNLVDYIYSCLIQLNDTKDWEGITLSLNFKQSPFAGNSNGGKIFGWGSADWAQPGFFISLSYGIVFYKQGISNVRYDYEDAEKIGYNESIPEKRYLTFRPFRDERWHQIIISMRKIAKDEEKYLTELSL